MKRRFNYTGRVELEASEVLVSVGPGANGVPTFSATLHLEERSFPHDARILLEVDMKNLFHRYAWGSMGNLEPLATPEIPGLKNEDLQSGLPLYFRVKIVSSTGQIIAHRNRFKPSMAGLGERRTGLLLVAYQDLDDLAWDLELLLDSSSEPRLIINNRIPGVDDLVRHDAGFHAFVIPEVLKRILTHIVVNGYHEDEDATWARYWMDLATCLVGQPEVDEDGRDAWIALVVQQFCRTHQVFRRFIDSREAM
ncbi:MAG: hypothetical protein H6739_36085 [Alphaproteobacteria bacterium]|nr:hypothetical protein [Alphaproteobacteria bacterium]